ncbi:glutathione synthetase [Geobacillus sp. 46C-IIa]|uniref:YheC/YheD family endospore coat-associated protein n=1 Tax=Geobacillus sp. 46C-IIa TaxID=1963025 RepID=UPI0009BE9A7B|nr:YheC/YheD family protein [Geobacillus sp. 46C-IIa]OQP06912.1 glutathione synthetase [Geobacillus sp. 46C-IIa]QNU27370.1 YheC/YheD family protein [Geobacillus sp. 46C-IIa]
MTYTLLIDDKGENTVTLPASLQAAGQTAAAFGSRLVPCRIVSSSALTDCVVITSDIARRLSIPFVANVHVFLTAEAVHVGPLVGILTAGFTKSLHRPVGNRSFFFAKLLAQEKQVGGFAFLFGTSHIDWENGMVNGYFYTERGWERHAVPLPTVIYNRLPNRRIENDETFQTITETLQTAYGIPVFNGHFFNKWEIYRRLASHPEAQPYLPATAAHITWQTVDQFLARYTEAYVKPADGSLGRGICHLVKKNNVYECRFRDEQGETKTALFPTAMALWHHLLANAPLHRYVIQQAVPLMTVNGRPTDFRVHTNKNEYGQWQVSAIAAKIAGKQSITTHMNSGGIVKTLEEIFPDTAQRETVLTRLHHAALTLSRCLDETSETLIGEIGFDLGVDKQGRIWMFEANSKPGRSIFQHPGLKEADERTVLLPLAYAVHLSKTAITEPEALWP